MVDTFSKEIRTKTMKAVKQNHTKLEDSVIKELWKRGFRFRRNVRKLRGTPDIAIEKYKIVIFIDSCFWHGCEIHGSIPENNREYWKQKINRNKKRDEEITDFYRNHGWNVLRTWEHQLKINFSNSVDEIIEFINSSKLKSSKM